MTMIGGSSRSWRRTAPQAFGNIQLYRDEIGRTGCARLADDVHDARRAVMIQITHLGRRTTWAKGDWLPMLAPTSMREPAHRAFPKEMEDWDIERVVAAYADAAERVQAAGLDGIELECYGHLHRPLLVARHQPPRRRVRRQPGEPDALRRRGDRRDPRRGRAATSSSACGWSCDEQLDRGHRPRRRASRSRARLAASGKIDFINVIRGHIDTEEGLSHVIPGMGDALGPAPRFRRRGPGARWASPTLHARRIQDVATARHAVASGKLDLVGMTRAQMADPHIVAQDRRRRARTRIRPCVGMGYCIDAIYNGDAQLHPQRRHRPRADACRT